MSKPILFRLRVRTTAAVRSFVQRAEGVAAVEFALIVPIMVMLFMGAVEMSQAVTVNRRVTQVGSTAGDLVARYNGNISSTDIEDIMKVSAFLLAPYSPNKLKVDISVIASTAVSATDTKQKWKCSYDSAVSTSVTCTCPNSAFTLPSTGMLTTSDSVVVANVTYGYTPTLFNFSSPKTINGATLGGSMGAGQGGYSATYNMSETVYLKPRAACPTITKSDASTCGC